MTPNPQTAPPRYPAYRHSGVEWIGEIPSHWEVRRLKYIANITYGISPDEKSYNLDGEGMVLVNGPAEYSLEDFGHTRAIKWTTRPVKFAEKGSLLFCLRGSTTGRLNICHEDLAIGRGCAAIMSNYEQDFLAYAVISLKEAILDSFRGSTFPSVTSQQLDNYLLTVPPLPEQRAISRFLDEKTAQIDRAIGQKQRLIELLQERRQVLIQQAVTRGLDPSVPLRESGVDWMGEVPAHWEVRRAKYLLIQSREEPEKGDGVVTAFRDGEVTLRTNRRTEGFTIAVLEGGYQKVRPGQLVINSMDAFEGAIGVSDSEGKCTPEYVVCNPKGENVSAFYFAYLLREMALAKYIQVVSNAVRQRAIRFRYSNLKDQFLPLPPLEEQQAIVSHIESQSAQIERAIGLQQRHIAQLREYRSVLIHEVVTGKVRVG